MADTVKHGAMDPVLCWDHMLIPASGHFERENRLVQNQMIAGSALRIAWLAAGQESTGIYSEVQRANSCQRSHSRKW